MYHPMRGPDPPREPVRPAAKGPVRRTATDLEPFRVPAFRRYLVAATLTSVSLWVYTTALNWTMLADSGSAAVVGLVSTLMTLPLPFAAVPGGMLTDRLGPRDLMVLALLAEAACVGATGLLAATGSLTVPLALLLALIFGIADGLYVVPSQVLVGRVVPPHQMPSAIGTSMLTIGLGRILGGTAGGALVAGLGPQGAMIPGAIGVVAAAITIRSLPRVRGSGGGARLSRSDLADGLRWFGGAPGARALVLLGAVSALFLWPYLGLLAVVVRDLLQGTPQDLGLLTAAGGVGAILAAVSMGLIGRRMGRGRQLVAVMVLAGMAEVVLGLSHTLTLTLVAATVLATMTVTHTATSSLIIQAIAPLDLRGRALALYGFVFFGAMPFGFLGAGIAADAVGVGAVLVGLGVMTVAGAIVVVRVDRGLVRLDVAPIAADEPAPALTPPGPTGAPPDAR